MPIAFVTGNTEKFQTARDHLARFDIPIEQVPLHLDEIQGIDVAAVAEHKAHQAYLQLGRPLFVEDSSFEIEEFDGWPGPMAKHAIAAIGASGFARLGDLTQDRRCRFVSVLVHVDSDGAVRDFRDVGDWGTLAHAPSDPDPALGSWSELWQVFVPPGHQNPLASLRTERAEVLDDWSCRSVFTRYGDWLAQHGR